MAKRLFLLMSLCIAPALLAQGPDAQWRTLTTPHFRIHYPVQYEAWTQRMASHIESVRAVVVNEVGYDPPQVADIIVENPAASANGETLPLLDSPRIVLYAEAPTPELVTGEFNDWIDLLTIHEMTHLVHLLRPSRNPTKRMLARVLPLDPITLGAPRWVIEGYATVIEGRISGSGRPSGSMRAAVLRKWAESGRLPTYSQLASDRRFLGMSMAYLAGSAYLEWLEQRAGAGSLRKLWARMTARQARSFGEAFEGVFGDRPDVLYGKFVADLTTSATALDRHPRLEGELWQETSRDSGDPAVSPDGTKLAVVLRDAKHHAKLVVWGTGPNPEAEKTKERIAKMLQRDPEDVAPVLAKPLPREPLFTLVPPDGGDVDTPRWTRDGKSILYTHRAPDREGFLHHDLYRWTPETKQLERVTHLADVSDADPLPDGTHAIAVRSRDGFSQLVTVDLRDGHVDAMTAPSLDVVYSHPRANDGGALVWAEHDASGWHVECGGRAAALVACNSGGMAAALQDAFAPEWGPNNQIYCSIARRGFIDIARLDAAGPVPITRVAGAAFDPAPAPDGSIYFMSLEPDGFVVRKVGTLSVPPGLPPENATLVPAVPPEPPKPVALVAAPLPPSRRYGIGRQELEPFVGGQWTSQGSSTEFGVRMGDVIGRLDTLLLGAISSRDAPGGGALVTRWRGLPVDLGLHLFSARGEHGVEGRATWTAHFASSRFAISGGGVNHRAFAESTFTMWQRDTASEAAAIAIDSNQHARGTLAGAVQLFGLNVGGRITAARHVAVGGVRSSIEPESLFIARITDPALPRDALIGNYTGARVNASSGPVMAFAQRHRAGGVVRDVFGLELTLAHAPEPLVKAPGLDLTAGIARVRQEHSTRGWLSIRWRP